MFVYPVLILGAAGMVALISVLGIIGYLGNLKVEIDYGSVGKHFFKHLRTYKETTKTKEGKVGKFYYLFYISIFVGIISLIYLVNFLIHFFTQ